MTKGRRPYDYEVLIEHASVSHVKADTNALSVIIPAHNEERRIGKTLTELLAALPGAEIIVVVNNSSDHTAEIVRSFTSDRAEIRLIDVPARIGKGGAVRIGFGLATRSFIAFVDADGATSGKEVYRLLSSIEGYDCVAASRWLPGAKIDVRQSATRRFLSRGFNACVRLLFGMRLTDTQCGAKLFRSSVLQQVLDEVETADFAFDVDLLYAVHRRGLRIREVATQWREQAGSSVNVRAAVPRMFLSLIRLRMRHSLLRLFLPIFDRYFKLSPIRSRRALRYLVFAPHDGRSPDSSDLERNVRAILDQIESPTREIVWFAARQTKWWFPVPARLRAMVTYIRRFRDEFDCVLEVLPAGSAFMTPLYSLKPKVVVKERGSRLPPVYSSASIIESSVPSKRQIEEALILAMTRTTMHVYADADGHLVLGECVSPQSIRKILIARGRTSA